MVRVDGAYIRKKIKKDYEKALRDLEQSRGLFEQFEQTDRPQFTRWFSSHFGALLTELRELNAKLAADESIILMVESEVMFGGGSYASAYKRVMDQRNNPEPPPQEESDEKEDRFDEEADPKNSKDSDDPFKAFFDSLFGEAEPEEEPRERAGFRDRTRPKAAEPAQVSRRLKELYRAVVRRLHPDSQREMTPQKTEWWHQAQAAYEAGDADQLEVILTLCEIGEGGTTAHTSASLLQRITAQLKNSLRAIKQQISQLRREPAWNFSKRADRTALAEKIRSDLAYDLGLTRQRWRHAQDLIAKWKIAAEKLRTPRRRKARPKPYEFPF